MSELQRCSRCGEVKPVSEFLLRSGTVRRQSYCRPCKQEYDRRWYARNKDRHLLNVAKINQRARERNAAIVDRLKDVPCADCGKRYPPHMMDFDHVRGKKYRDIAKLVAFPASVETLLAEIDKCEPVCSNCHRHRTWARRRRPASDS